MYISLPTLQCQSSLDRLNIIQVEKVQLYGFSKIKSLVYRHEFVLIIRGTSRIIYDKYCSVIFTRYMQKQRIDTFGNNLVINNNFISH